MQKIWICEKRVEGDVDFFSGYASEIDALRCACSCIINEIINRDHIWDMSSYDIAETASRIHTKAHSGDIDEMRSALGLYSDFQSNAGYAEHYSVFYTTINNPDLIEKLDDDFFTALISDDDDEVSEEEIEEDVKAAAKATGATCRKCTTYNEYATPDTDDNTYCCRQCSAFINIFSQEQ